MICSKCSEPIDDSTRFCAKCGSPAVSGSGTQEIDTTSSVQPIAPSRVSKSCPYCGEQIMEAAIKCRFCGSDLTQPAGAQLAPRGGSNITLNAPTVPAATAVPSIIIQNVQAHQAPPSPAYISREIKNPGVALLLSIVFPGGGQFYNGQAGKGILVLLTFWILGISYIWSLFDAYSSAQRINRVGF